MKVIVDKNISDELEDALSKYNVDNFVAISLDGKNDDIILSTYNKESDGTFIDLAKGYRVKVDHVKKRAISVEDIDKDTELNEIYNDLLQYVNNKYPNVVKFGVFKDDDDFKVIIIGEKNSPVNFWNGRWISEYTFTGSELQGVVKIDVHYYEDGNVRLQSSEVIDSVQATKSNLVSVINKVEDSLQKKLSKSFLDLNETKFKNLRRQLPITRSKMNWGKAIGNYRLGKDVANQ